MSSDPCWPDFCAWLDARVAADSSLTSAAAVAREVCERSGRACIVNVDDEEDGLLLTWHWVRGELLQLWITRAGRFDWFYRHTENDVTEGAGDEPIEEIPARFWELLDAVNASAPPVVAGDVRASGDAAQAGKVAP